MNRYDDAHFFREMSSRLHMKHCVPEHGLKEATTTTNVYDVSCAVACSFSISFVLTAGSF